jgi:membrane carboxypeptidase/penicillin-binding protein
VLDTNGYGQGIAVTPLQLVRMVAAIGNDGKLMRPYVVERRCRGDDCVITQPKQIGNRSSRSGMDGAPHAGEIRQPLCTGCLGGHDRSLP